MTKQIEDYPELDYDLDELRADHLSGDGLAPIEIDYLFQQIDSLTEQNKELQKKLEPDMFWDKDNSESSFDSIEELFEYHAYHEKGQVKIECMTAVSMPNKTFVGRYDEGEYEWIVTELNKESK